MCYFHCFIIGLPSVLLIEKRGYLPRILLWQVGNKKHDYYCCCDKKENLAIFLLRSNWSLKILQFNFRIGSMQYAWWQSSGKMAITCELMGRWHDNIATVLRSTLLQLSLECALRDLVSIFKLLIVVIEVKFPRVFTPPLGITTWNATIIASFSEW